MSLYDCEFDDDARFFDYRESIKISNGNIRCFETGVNIPEGFPFAMCEGVCSYNRDWETFTQAIEVWRFFRNQKRKDETCFGFGEINEVFSDLEYDSKTKLLALRWGAIRKRVSERYSKNTPPRLHEWEKEALESGKCFDWIEYPPTLRFLNGKPFPAPTSAGAEWVPCSEECSKCGLVFEECEIANGICEKCEEVSK